MEPAPPPNGEMSELERRLLDAARHDRVPDALSSRMAEGLGLRVAGAVVQQGVATSGAPLFAKAGLWGFLSIALVAAVLGSRAVRSAPHESRTPQPPRASAARDAPATTNAAALAAPLEPSPVDPIATTPAPAAAAPAPSPVRSAAASDDAALRAEIALLDRARKALREHAGAQALHLLDQHHRRFARGTLAPEAAALRIDALVQQGAYEQAGTMSRQFVAAYPTHPLREHVADLTAPHDAASR